MITSLFGLMFGALAIGAEDAMGLPTGAWTAIGGAGFNGLLVVLLIFRIEKVQKEQAVATGLLTEAVTELTLAMGVYLPEAFKKKAEQLKASAHDAVRKHTEK